MIFHVVVLSRAILYFYHGSLATWTFEFDVFARESIYPWDTAFPFPVSCQFQTVTSWQRSRSDVAELFIEVGVKGGCRSDQQSAGSLAIKILWRYMQFQCLWCLHFSVNCRFSFCWSGAVFLVPSGYMCILLARFLFPYVCMLPFLALLAPLALLALWLVSWLPCLWVRFDSSSYLCLSILYVFYCIVLWRGLLLSLWFDCTKNNQKQIWLFAEHRSSVIVFLCFANLSRKIMQQLRPLPCSRQC